MPGPIGGRRRRIRAAYDALCAAIATALGASDAAREAGRRAHLDALVELWIREAGPGGDLGSWRANPALAHVVRAVEADAAAGARAPATDLPELDGIVAGSATGSAGDPPHTWIGTVGDLDGNGQVPGLWRIGTGRLGGGAPFHVAVPLLDESHLQLGSRPESRASAIALVESLAMRVTSRFRPGTVALHVWDVGQLTGPLPGLHPLTRTGLLTVHDPSGLPQLLEDLSDRIRRVHTRVLVDGHPSLRALAAETGERTEPWVVAVLVGNRQALREEDHRQLQRVARGGLACGVQLVLVDVPMTVGASVETVDIGPTGTARTSMTGPYVVVEPDPPLPAQDVTAACHAIADVHEAWRSRISTFAELLPKKEWWAESSAEGLHAPVGFVEGRPVPVVLADMSPHALVGGPSGSGKTNLMLAMIGALTTRYSPDELELYLLDFKEGVSFAQFAPGRHDGTWLPHARLVGVNINTDREFGLALLQFLADEMRRRAEAAKAHEVTKLEDLRRVDPMGRWPRIVAVIDEFQYLFFAKDAVTRVAMALLEDVARRGRSQGIHLVLASQDVSGIEAFWGRPAIFEQFVLRIALPRARRVLDDRNEATRDLPRWHAVLNHESGIRHGNEIVRVPDASSRGTLDEVQRRLHADDGGKHDEPRLFDGSRSPRLADLLALLPAGEPPRALVGQCIDVAGSPATVALPDAPGRNVAVLGAGARDAVRVLEGAAGAMATRFPAGGLDVVIAPLVAESHEPAARLAQRFVAAGHTPQVVRLDALRERVEALAADVTARLADAPRRPTVVVLYAADAADTALGRTGTEALRTLLHFGPETGVHVLGWWRSVPRLKALLMMGATVDDLGAWVALDVQGSEVQSLVPGLLMSWSPRPGRGLFFDRAQHSAPEVVIVAAPSDDPVVAAAGEAS